MLNLSTLVNPVEPLPRIIQFLTSFIRSHEPTRICATVLSKLGASPNLRIILPNPPLRATRKLMCLKSDIFIGGTSIAVFPGIKTLSNRVTTSKLGGFIASASF